MAAFITSRLLVGQNSTLDGVGGRWHELSTMCGVPSPALPPSPPNILTFILVTTSMLATVLRLLLVRYLGFLYILFRLRSNLIWA
ncbi:hypothetical protein L1887_27427 [Cichorium endivia]|nr:hypothetical protein L1887_27427 [Cichorium endivia]